KFCVTVGAPGVVAGRAADVAGVALTGVRAAATGFLLFRAMKANPRSLGDGRTPHQDEAASWPTLPDGFSTGNGAVENLARSQAPAMLLHHPAARRPPRPGAESQSAGRPPPDGVGKRDPPRAGRARSRGGTTVAPPEHLTAVARGPRAVSPENTPPESPTNPQPATRPKARRRSKAKRRAVSPKQGAANQANARKSTGPRTEAAQARARRHGPCPA